MKKSIDATKKHAVRLTFLLDEDISPHELAQKIATVCGGSVLRPGEGIRVDHAKIACVVTDETLSLAHAGVALAQVPQGAQAPQAQEEHLPMIIVRHHATCAALDGLTGTCDCKGAPMDLAACEAVAVFVDALVHESRVVEEDREHLALRLDMLAERIKDEAIRVRRLAAEPRVAATTDDLPPDAATGLYLDRPFDVDDLKWIKLAWASYLGRYESGGPPRPFQLMLVFQTIRRDARATEEFLRVMNTIVLPLCRRLRLQEQPHLRDLGAASK